MPIELKLYDTIGGWGISAAEFTAQIPADAESIVVRINSPGGEVGDGLAMFNFLKDHPAHVTTIVDGYAASSASVVMLAGDEIKVHKSSIVMVHNPWTMTMGNADELRKEAEVLDEHSKAILSVYQDATGLSESELIDMMADETWMRGEAAVDMGFASALIDGQAEEPELAAASAAWASMLSAIQGGNELMSTQKTRKEITGERDELQARLDALTQEKADVDARMVELEATVEAGAEATVEAHAAEITVRDEQIVSLTAQVAERDEVIAETSTKVDGLTEQVDAQSEQIDALGEQVEQAQVALANPAYVDAQMQEAKDLAQAAIDAEADEAEAAAKAAEEDEAEAAAPTFAKWQAIENARDKGAYWNEHRDAILADVDKQNDTEEDG